VGTGYSYSDNGDMGLVIGEKEMADNMFEFLQRFFVMYPQYQKLPFFVTGESYAGHYIPALSARIFDGNNRGEGVHINLRGLAIGNGLVDPILQYPQYALYAWQHQIITEGQFILMSILLPPCIDLIQGCIANNSMSWLLCLNAYAECNPSQIGPIEFSGLNVYDIREQCEDPPLCYDFSLVSSFLQQPDVIAALNVAGHSWVDCNMLVNLEFVFAGDWMLNFADDLPALLAANISVLVYNGEYDYICNWYGSNAWVHGFDWFGHDQFNRAQNITWNVDNEEAGSSVSALGLTFLRVKDSGHMVPLNQPKRALSMLGTFMAGQPFD